MWHMLLLLLLLLLLEHHPARTLPFSELAPD
jgi:hypothetical protein